MFGNFETWRKKRLKLDSPYPMIEAPDARIDPGAEGIALGKFYGFPETSVLGSGFACGGTVEPITEGLLATGPAGIRVSLGEVALDEFTVDPAMVGPWAG